MRQLLLAFQFLTIIPVKKDIIASETDLAKSTSFFPLVGLLQGIMLMIADFGLSILFHHDLVIGLLLVLLILTNGGFHLDGLSDTFDAIATKSSGNRDEDIKKRLSIMKDSASGPAGVIAIICAIGLKYLSLKNFSHLEYSAYYSSLLLMPVMSKWTMVLSMYHGTRAREDGLGRIFIGNTGIKEVVISSLTVLLVIALPPVFFRSYISENYFIFYPSLLIILYLFVRLVTVFFNKRLGGLTGDVLGAISETTEIIFLLMVIIWSRLSI